MIETQIVETLRALQRTIWQSVLTSAAAAALVSALVCVVITSVCSVELRDNIDDAHRRIDTLSAVIAYPLMTPPQSHSGASEIQSVGREPQVDTGVDAQP